MFILQLNNLKNLNVSLQVGDGIYAHASGYQSGANDLQTTPTSGTSGATTGINQFIGVLAKIDDNGNNQYDLHVDDSIVVNAYQPQVDDFIMFSKFSQGDSGVLGYYAEAKFVNDSTEKAELFAVSSEVIINSN